MAQSQYPARAVRAKTSEVVDYHKDEAKPGKPLYLLIPGGLIALASLALVIWVAYATWFDGSLPESRGLAFILLLAPVYIVGVFMFSYGYELYDVPKALRLTAIIVVITVAAVVIIAVLFALLGDSTSSSGKSSSSASRSGSSRGAGLSAPASSGGGSGIGNALGPLFIDTGSTRTVTHEVVREVPVASPAPTPLTCPYCGRLYLAAENNFACPNCGAATPPELRAQI
jgi:hypothetical protein